MNSAKPSPGLVKLLWVMTAILVTIGVAVVTRRIVNTVSPTPPRSFPEAAAMDVGFTQHPLLTLVHILPGLLFIVLAPWQFMASLRKRRPRLHRWMGRVALIGGVIAGTSALVMSPQMAIGGLNETVATMLFAIVFLVSLARAYVSIRRGQVAVHREWTIRAFAIGLAVTTIRPIVGVFFATRRLTHLTPHDFFGPAFWLGFTLHLIAAETWINYTRTRNQVA